MTDIGDWNLEPMDPHDRDCVCRLCGEAHGEEFPECVSCGAPATELIRAANEWCCSHCASDFYEANPGNQASQLALQWEDAW